MEDTVAEKSDSDPCPRPRPLVLLLLDGWGVAPAGEANAISVAKTPFFLTLLRDYPAATLAAGDGDINARYRSLGTGRGTAEAPVENSTSLSAVIATVGGRQIKIAETERFAALTSFFNGGTEEKLPGEEWRIVSSESGRHTIKLPLALRRTVKEIIKAIDDENGYDLIVASMPILDLTAAAGDFAATRQAAEILDRSLASIIDAVDAKGGVAVISAACGNAEKLRNLATELADTEMTDNPVPFIIFGAGFKGQTIGLPDAIGLDLSLIPPAGSLADVAPTILKIMGREKPAGMTGRSLID